MNQPPVVDAPSSLVRKSPLIALGNILFRHRNRIFPIAFLAIVTLDRPRYPLGSPAWDRGLDAIGIILALAGQMLRALVIGLAYIRRGGKGGKVYADDLVQDGIFAHSRNPLYVGNFAVFLGLFVILNSPLGYLLGVSSVCLAYLSITLAEEAFLRGKFGAVYEDYCRRVNRFLPRLHGLRETVASMRFDWKRVVRKEYGSTWTWLTTAILLMLWEKSNVEGWPTARPHLPIYLTCFGVVTISYLVARFLKKTGRLES
jgi:protein-S-isoprenylcysteine O-methyltransferase Ste14